MKRLAFAAAAAALICAAPARAQHHDHGAHAPEPPAQETDPHAGHGSGPADPHAGHTPPVQQADPHAGHAPDTEAVDPHAGHRMEAEAGQDPPVAPPPAGALSGPSHAADATYGEAAMAAAREELRREHGAITTSKLMLDRLEARSGHGGGYGWDAQFRWGGDHDRLWLKSEGEGGFGGRLERFETQALWSRAIDPWFDVQLGVRHDFRPRAQRTYLALGVQGLAPRWFEVDAALFLSDRGDLSARVEGEYDLRITPRLILQPRVELDFALQDVPDLAIGSGLASGAAGVRLRYEVRPYLAPYVGVEWEGGIGRTRRLLRARGEDRGGVSLVAGIRFWM